jgi:hypothetical protein
MSTIRSGGLIFAAINRALAFTSIDIYIHDLDKTYESLKQIILADKILTDDERTDAIKAIEHIYDRHKIWSNLATKRICENCNQKCLATTFCEYCIRNYLKENFSNWTSGNYDINNLIHKCQKETLVPNLVIQWIPFNNLKNILYLTKGGFSEIYTASWINGYYKEWDSRTQQLKRFGTCDVILKKLENVESANQSWFEEVCILNLFIKSSSFCINNSMLSFRLNHI